MPVELEFFLQYAYLILFLWVLVEQVGVPIPCTPLLVTAGTLTATHKLSLTLVLVAIVSACALSDTMWFLFGQRYGRSVVRMLCRLSFEAGACVQRTTNYFSRHGAGALLFAKFVPGLATVAAPIAGQSGMPYARFLALDLAGALIWGAALTMGGRVFGDVLKRHPHALSWVGHFAGLLFILALLGFVAHRLYRQRKFLKEIHTARLEPEDLKARMERGENLFLVDLRHPLDRLPDPRVLPGAHCLTPAELIAQKDRIPDDAEIVLYCTCPSEATAARVALRLRRAGIANVHPLRGGFEAWKKLGYPLEPPPGPVHEAGSVSAAAAAGAAPTAG